MFYFVFQLKADFIQLLKETSDIDRHSRWSETKRKIDSDPRYKAVDSSSRREDWFKDYVRKLEDKREKDKEKEKDEVEIWYYDNSSVILYWRFSQSCVTNMHVYTIRDDIRK